MAIKTTRKKRTKTGKKRQFRPWVKWLYFTSTFVTAVILVYSLIHFWIFGVSEMVRDFVGFPAVLAIFILLPLFFILLFVKTIAGTHGLFSHEEDSDLMAADGGFDFDFDGDD
jgi:hypothetical protein